MHVFTGGVAAVRPALLVLPARARAVDTNRAEEVDDLAVQEELDRVVACVPCMTEIYLHIYMFDARMTYRTTRKASTRPLGPQTRPRSCTQAEQPFWASALPCSAAAA